jgi:cell division protein DivIC
MKNVLGKKLLKVVTNKYFITSLIFVVWCMYFDQNDWLSIRQKQKELDNIKGNIAYLNGEIAQMAAERDGLLTDRNKLEQYARETYRMKHDNEDVYVIDTSGK